MALEGLEPAIDRAHTRVACGLNDARCLWAADPDGFFIAEFQGEPVGSVAAVAYGPSFGFGGLYVARPELGVVGSATTCGRRQPLVSARGPSASMAFRRSTQITPRGVRRARTSAIEGAPQRAEQGRNREPRSETPSKRWPRTTMRSSEFPGRAGQKATRRDHPSTWGASWEAAAPVWTDTLRPQLEGLGVTLGLLG